MKTIAVIPARMGSTRYPGKPLAPLLGRPMIEHIYKRVALSTVLDATYIATCDEAIRQAAEDFGAPVIMTADTHTSDPVSVALYIELDAILAVVIGGGSLSGGRIYLGMTVIGALVIQALTTATLISGLPPEYNLIIKALVVLTVLFLQSANARKAIRGLVSGKTS